MPRKQSIDNKENAVKFYCEESTSVILIDIEYDFDITRLANITSQISKLQILASDIQYHGLDEDGYISAKTNEL